MGLIRDVAELEPEFRAKVLELLNKLKALDIQYTIIETRRRPATQEAYYAQGRESLAVVNAARRTAGLWPITAKENERCVTWTRKSKHLLGLAIDIAPADSKGNPRWSAPDAEWRRIAEIAKELGLESGYFWAEKDSPHIQAR